MAGFAALLTKQNIEITEMMTAAIMHNTAMQQQTDSSPQTLQQWLAYCEQLHPKGIQGIELGLDRLRSVASRMHNGAGVHFDYPVFTVAGTNGKGSSCTMLEGILRHAGYRTGLFTSPHLVHFTERCKINNQPVDEATLAQHFARVEQARDATPLTYFEFTTLAILDCLASAGLDALTDAERASFQQLNADYVAKHGFPFIIAVRDHSKASILAAFHTRIANDTDTVFATACAQVERIAELRLQDMLK